MGAQIYRNRPKSPFHSVESRDPIQYQNTSKIGLKNTKITWLLREHIYSLKNSVGVEYILNNTSLDQDFIYHTHRGPKRDPSCISICKILRTGTVRRTRELSKGTVDIEGLKRGPRDMTVVCQHFFFQDYPVDLMNTH